METVLLVLTVLSLVVGGRTIAPTQVDGFWYTQADCFCNDINGGTTETSPSVCADKCRAQSGCVGFAWKDKQPDDPDPLNCFIKSTVCLDSHHDHTYLYVGVIASAEPVPGYYYITGGCYANDLIGTYVQSPTECGTFCNSDTACVGFEYYGMRNKLAPYSCYTKSYCDPDVSDSSGLYVYLKMKASLHPDSDVSGYSGIMDELTGRNRSCVSLDLQDKRPLKFTLSIVELDSFTIKVEGSSLNCEDDIVAVTQSPPGGYYGRFEECFLTPGGNSSLCVYNCNCKVAAPCTQMHLFLFGGNYKICGIDLYHHV